MTVFCAVCDRVIASRQPYVDALTFKVLHASQTGHDCTIEDAS